MRAVIDHVLDYLPERLFPRPAFSIGRHGLDLPTITRLEPHRSIFLRGFDRRGAAAALHSASAGGFTLSGCRSDQADFAVAVLFDADDVYGHLFTSRYLPDFSLAGVTLDFDLAWIGCQSPTSSKYPSVGRECLRPVACRAESAVSGRPDRISRDALRGNLPHRTGRHAAPSGPAGRGRCDSRYKDARGSAASRRRQAPELEHARYAAPRRRTTARHRWVVGETAASSYGCGRSCVSSTTGERQS